MSDKWARIFAGIAVIGLGWIVVYWWMSPAAPKISFDAAGPASARASSAPPPQPRPKPQMVDLPKPQQKGSRPATPKVSIESPIVPKAVAPRTSEPPPPAKSGVSTPSITPPQFSDYKIKSGDTLDSIATMELGAAKHAQAIRRANPFKDLDKLKVGDTIKIPLDPTNIQGKPNPQAPAPTAPVEHREEAVEYTVQAGDTLSKIAKDQYGNQSFKNLILEANKDRLKSGGDALKVGQKLRIPPKPKS